MANVGKVNMNNNICLNHNLYLAIRKTSELVWKKESSPCWFGASIKIHPNLYLYFVSPKWKIWLWRPKSIPQKAERKRPRSTLLFINLSKFWRKKKNRARLARKQSQKQRNQIFLSSHLIHGRLQCTKDPHIKNRAVNRAWNLYMIHTKSPTRSMIL